MSEIIETRVNYNEMSEIESFCPGCEKNGVTRLLFCKIPFYGDVIVSSFNCPHCYLKNSEIQSAKELQDHGKRFKLKVTKEEDLHRMVVTSPHCKVFIPELDFEVPNVKKGSISTVEGLFDIFIGDLTSQQPIRKITDPVGYEKIQAFIGRLKDFASAKPECLPYYFILEDPAGNSFVENPLAPMKDLNLTIQEFKQTREHLITMGYMADDPALKAKEMEQLNQMEKENQMKKTNPAKPFHYGDKEISDMIGRMHNAERRNLAHKTDSSMPFKESEVDLDEKLCIFQVDCYSCFKQSELRTYRYEIPFFKEIIIMSFKCQHCGYKDTEVKIGGEIAPHAKKITVLCNKSEDLDRDIFKSDTTSIRIKELDFEMMPGSLGSFYSTIEGLFGLIIDRLEEANPFKGDSTEIPKLNVIQVLELFYR